MTKTMFAVGGFLALGLALQAIGSAQAAAPNPQKIIAVLDSTQNFGTTRRAVNFYDVTTLSGTVFNQTPLFSVWTGYEDAATANFEDPDTITVNPVNGTIYLEAYDSGTPGTVSLGDTGGDFDLYRIDYQEILSDYVTNSRPMGTMYAPSVDVNGNASVAHPDHVGTTVFISGAIQKIGEVGRNQGGPFFDTDMEFVNPGRMVFLDNQIDLDAVNDDVAHDHVIRSFNRVATTPGSAKADTPTTNEGGWNQQTTESWESRNMGAVDMDNGSGRSEVVDLAYVKRDGVEGIWVGESDGGGDDVSFFVLDFTAMTATKREIKAGSSPYATGFALDEHPEIDPNTNDGEFDWIVIDGSGNIKIGESGYYDTGTIVGGQTGSGGAAGAEEPKVISRAITNYNGPDTDSNSQNEVVPGAWSTSKAMPVPGADDDTAVTEGRFVTYDKGTGLVYFFDNDSGAAPNVVSDVYVFDPSTGTLVYQEQNAANHFLERHGIRLFLRGDATGDGLVTDEDIDEFFDTLADPTMGGTVTSAIGQEWFDLTGDGLLTSDDMDELIEVILETAYGDANLDGIVDGADYTLWADNYLETDVGWATGDFTGNGIADGGDYTLWADNYGFGAPAMASAVPEPSSWILAGLGALGIAAFGRRRKRA